MSSLPSENHHVPKHHALPFMSLPSIQVFNFMAQRHDTAQDLAQAQDANDPKVEELLTQEKAPASTSIDQEVDLDELMDDPELEKLHADRIAALKNAPFFIAKLAIKLLPCDILFRNGIGTDRLVGFQDLGGKDDFTTKTLEALLIRKGIINGIKGDGEDEDDDYHENKRRTVRSSVGINSDSN
ncbi:thioredoxin domain-containing protein PLP3B-like isoform X2 [Actinidia eriantha]|uniref:thioredoxin domain-containing protein PLP3B-like isoform X2 n=1 Tax=Actinidia eriantha TaxID=165200 RepID=UPI0025880685|nr:thioredoxin domain-containing protein PLP3B-like isoform X2 [Actinidia eriantha]XP_057485020.1 thioredoxin domain-containing protein PLP3B-like isoform X2 [Actinidia eriantha]